MSKIVIEVSIITYPKLLKVDNPNEYLKKTKIGRDGLIDERGSFSELLLPQVTVELRWNIKTFLEHTCYKAFIPTDSWKKLDTKIYTFEAIVFEEIEPLERIRRKEIGE